MELREIAVEDVYPDEKNPRKDFGDIAALAESCMLNAINPGEPVNPIVVVEDGGIYRIVDGERRYKAMCRNKLKRCHAVVCSDLDEANAMVAMVATDDKQQLSDIERSRGVQQMLLLGVDPEKVERAGRIPKGSAAKLRRARAAVDDAGDDMTLDRMLAIAEFQELGDVDAVERLSSCRESEWQEVARAERDRRRDDEMRSVLLLACEEAGIPISENRLYGQDGWIWCKDVKDPDGIAAAAETHPGCYGHLIETYNALAIELCKPASDGEAAMDPEKVERLRRIDEVKEAFRESKAERASWFDACLGNLESIPHVAEIVGDEALSGYDGVGESVKAYESATGSAVDRGLCPMLAVHGWRKASTNIELPSWMAEFLVDGNLGCYADKAERVVEWMDAFEADGYAPTAADCEIRILCEAALANREEIEDEEE